MLTSSHGATFGTDLLGRILLGRILLGRVPPPAERGGAIGVRIESRPERPAHKPVRRCPIGGPSRCCSEGYGGRINARNLRTNQLAAPIGAVPGAFRGYPMGALVVGRIETAGNLGVSCAPVGLPRRAWSFDVMVAFTRHDAPSAVITLCLSPKSPFVTIHRVSADGEISPPTEDMILQSE